MGNKSRTNAKPGPTRSNRKSGAAGRNAPEGTSPQHTDAQREQIQAGLRILARMIARSHLRRETSRAAQEQPPEPGTGG